MDLISFDLLYSISTKLSNTNKLKLVYDSNIFTGYVISKLSISDDNSYILSKYPYDVTRYITNNPNNHIYHSL